jgi:hypothetical protein
MQTESQKEQKKFLLDNKSVYRFVKSRGWVIVKNRLLEQINDMQSIMNVEGNQTPEQIVIDLKVRRAVCEELIRWVKSIEGQAEQFENNETSLPQEQKSYIMREE